MIRSLMLAAALLWAPTTLAAPSCWPGQATAANVEAVTNPPTFWNYMQAPQGGYVVSWWCDERADWQHYGFVGFRSELDTTWSSLLSGVLTDYTLAPSLWSTNIKCSRGMELCNQYAELYNLLDAIKAQTKPAPFSWKVLRVVTGNWAPVFTIDPATGLLKTLPEIGYWVSGDASCKCELTYTQTARGEFCTVQGAANVYPRSSTATTALTMPENYLAKCGRTP